MSNHGYIYLFRDSGYETGVKVGYDATPGCETAWKCAPSYSPRRMLFEAAWEIPDRFMLTGQTVGTSRKKLEHDLHAVCGCLMKDMSDFPRTGLDWCLTTREQAQAAISGIIGAPPDIVAGHLLVRRPVTNDNFRNPRPSNVAGNRFKIAVWIYREMHTGRLKTAFVDDWTTPREKARRYSRNGIEEVAAFSYEGPITPEGNLSILRAWTDVVTEFGFGPDDLHYGWLREEAKLDDVTAFYGERLVKLDHNARAEDRPLGVRFSYNKSETPPSESEFPALPAVSSS